MMRGFISVILVIAVLGIAVVGFGLAQNAGYFKTSGVLVNNSQGSTFGNLLNQPSSPSPQPKPSIINAKVSSPSPSAKPSPSPIQQSQSVPAPVARIDNISPNPAKFQDKITIYGVNFGSAMGSINVTSPIYASCCAGIKPEAWSDTIVTGTIHLFLGKGNYEMEIQRADGQKSNKFAFSISAGQPIIDSFQKGNAPNTNFWMFTLQGSEFGATPGQVNFYKNSSFFGTCSTASSIWNNISIGCSMNLDSGVEYGVEVVTADGRRSSFKYVTAAY